MIRVLIYFITASLFISNLSLANDPVESYKKILENPHIPEAQKVQVREALKKYQAFNKKMESKTDFKNTKEWYGHFKYTWKMKRAQMDTLREKEKAKVRVKTEKNYKIAEEAKFQINKDFRAKLISSKKFPDNIKKINNFDNPANPFPNTVEKMFLNHIHGKIIEAKKKAAKTDEEKMRAKIMGKVGTMGSNVHAMSGADINFLIQEVKRYYEENEKRYIKRLNANRKAKREGLTNFMNFAKSIKFTPRPKDNSRFKVNSDRDYLMAMGELKCLPFSEPLIIQNYKVLAQTELRKFKIEAKIRIQEMNKLINIVIKSMDLEYLNNNEKEVRDTVISYQRRSIDYRSRDAFTKHNTDSSALGKDREASKAKIKKWTEDFVKKSNNKKLKSNVLYSKNQYWYGNLSAFN